MIDEKKLIESFRASLNTGRETFNIDLIVECIEAQPQVGDWIPCSEQLPEVPEGTDDDECPEFNVMIKGDNRATTLRCTPDGTWFDEFGYVYPVIFWQPLPEPYKGE